MAEFQWWLLLVGLVAGGGLVAVVFLEGSRREQDIDAEELPAEAQWISGRLASTGRTVAPDDVEAVLREHREYRNLPPPDRLEPVDELEERRAPAWRGDDAAADGTEVVERADRAEAGP